MFVLDVTLESLIRQMPTKIVHPALRRLNSKFPQCSEAYIKDLEENIVWHCLIKQLHDLHISNRMHKEKQCRVFLIDKEGKEYMKHVEKVCRKIKCCRIPYLP